MASTVDIKVVGLSELERRLGGLPLRIQNACLRKALRVAANNGKARLKPATPRRTGLAQRKLSVSVRVRGKGAFARVKYKERPGFYMRLYDQGDSRQPARPFFSAALGGYESEVHGIFMKALDDAVAAKTGTGGAAA